MSTLLRSELRPTTITPRRYQEEAIEKLFHRFRSGDRSSLVVHATGLGKTNLAGMVIRKGVERGRKALWITHRTDLATQTINSLERHGLDPQREQAESRAREWVAEPDVVVATVQSLQGRRLAQFPRDYFNLLVVDEAHRALGGQFRGIIEYFGGSKVLGLTATPEPPSGNLGEVFDSVADEKDIWFGWNAPDGPYLCPLVVVRRDVGYDLSELKPEGLSDYSPEDLAALFEPLVEPIANIILDEVQERQTLAYVPRVAAAQALATALKHLGMHADWVAGNDPDRDEKLDRFRSGDIQVLCNADLLGEGNDLPNVGAIVDAYPTLSQVKYAQRIGRGLRPDTEDCLLLCLASNYHDSRLVTPADLVPQARHNDAFADWIDALTETGGKVNLLDAVEKAKEKSRGSKEAPPVVRCRARRYQVGGKRTVLKPSGAAEILGCAADFRIARPPKNAHMPRITDKQLRILEKAGVKDAHRLSVRQASVLMERIIHGWNNDLASLPQVRFLISLGVDPATARAMKFKEASAEIERLKSL